MQTSGNLAEQKRRKRQQEVVLPPDLEDEAMCSLQQAAKFLNVSRDTLRRRCQSGVIPKSVLIGLRKKAYSRRTLKEIARNK